MPLHNDASGGKSFPLGATIYPEGVNFSLYSKNSMALELLLFDDVDDSKPVSYTHLTLPTTPYV